MPLMEAQGMVLVTVERSIDGPALQGEARPPVAGVLDTEHGMGVEVRYTMEERLVVGPQARPSTVLAIPASAETLVGV